MLNKPDTPGFWPRVDRARKQKGLTILELTRLAGLPYERIAKQRRAGRLPDLAEVYNLSQVLGLSMEYLIAGTEEGPQELKRQRLRDIARQLPTLPEDALLIIEMTLERHNTGNKILTFPRKTSL